MLWGHGGGNHRRYLVAWRLPYFPRMRVWGCVEELDEARIPYSRGAGRTRFRWQMGRWSRRVLVIRGLYRPLDISSREIDCVARSNFVAIDLDAVIAIPVIKTVFVLSYYGVKWVMD